MLIKLSIWLHVSVAEGPISWNLGPYLVPFFIACRLYSYWNLCLGCKSNEVKVGVRGWLSRVVTGSVYWYLLYFSMLLCGGRAGDAPFCCGAPSTLEQFCSACVSEGSFCQV